MQERDIDEICCPWRAAVAVLEFLGGLPTSKQGLLNLERVLHAWKSCGWCICVIITRATGHYEELIQTTNRNSSYIWPWITHNSVGILMRREWEHELRLLWVCGVLCFQQQYCPMGLSLVWIFATASTFIQRQIKSYNALVKLRAIEKTESILKSSIALLWLAICSSILKSLNFCSFNSACIFSQSTIHQFI